MNRSIKEIEEELARVRDTQIANETTLHAAHKEIQATRERTRELNQELERVRCELAGHKDLESQFRAAIAKHTPALDALVQEAIAKLEEAKELSKKVGVPFRTSIINLDDYESLRIKGPDTYVPSTVREIFPGVTEAVADNNYRSVLRDVVGIWGTEGWDQTWAPSSLGC